jgi:hypothetical protein
MYFLYKSEYRIFKPVEIIIRKGQRKKKSRRDEAIWTITLIYMKVPQGTFLVVTLKKQKCHFFFLLQNPRTEGGTGLPGGLLDTSGRKKEVGKGCRKANML